MNNRWALYFSLNSSYLALSDLVHEIRALDKNYSLCFMFQETGLYSLGFSNLAPRDPLLQSESGWNKIWYTNRCPETRLASRSWYTLILLRQNLSKHLKWSVILMIDVFNHFYPKDIWFWGISVNKFLRLSKVLCFIFLLIVDAWWLLSIQEIGLSRCTVGYYEVDDLSLTAMNRRVAR